MTTVTWCTFLPLLTAGILILVPASWKWLIKTLSLLGAVGTFIIAIGLVRGYSVDVDDARTALSAVQDRVIAGANWGPGPAYSGPEGILRWKTEFLTPVVDATGASRISRPAAWDGWSPAARDAWEEATELQLAMGVQQAEHIRFVEYVPWIPSFKVNYFVGVDGLSLPFIWLTALLCVLCFIYSWTIDKGTKGYYLLFLLLETGLIGVFSALDFFLFYVYWEVVLLPMYFLIGVWGGENRIYASIKFFIYTLVGSVLMLLAMLIMFFVSEPHSFNMLTLMQLVPSFSPGLAAVLFVGLFIGFAIKVPVFPFHTWLPDAHVEAPTAVSVILAGILLKMGGYGLIRISYSMLPGQATSKFFIAAIAILGMINIVYGAFCALAQKDFKKLVAYSSVSHMGYVLLGLAAVTPRGMEGAVLQMFNHGISSAMLFLIVGVIYERAHHRDLTRFGGMGLQMPRYTALATIGFFASLGLPGLNGFISEFLCFFGAYDFSPEGGSLITTSAGISAPWIIYVSLLGIVLAAVYVLWTIQRVYLGNVKREEYKRFPDVSFREVLVLTPLAFLCILLGVLPGIILDFMKGSLLAVTQMVRSAVGN
ncbi:MAG TPA: NADH-quinone oxidoreductase subunit M [Planctomycetota bacterium]|nr:NADH-quinone oxidoreductase subunit M [Planctomycetota bacterium]